MAFLAIIFGVTAAGMGNGAWWWVSDNHHREYGRFTVNLPKIRKLMSKHQKHPGYLSTVLSNRCPRCREGQMFETSNPYTYGKVLKMNETCPVCHQPTEIEVGFYYGTAYVSYALTVAFSVATFIAWWVLLGFSLEDGDLRVLYWGITNAVLMIALQPVFMRLSRSIWISWFVKYEPDWKDKEIKPESLERVVPGHMGNW